MKKQAVFTIVACSVAALFLIGVLIIGLRSDGFGIGKLKAEAETSGVKQEDGRYRYEYSWDPAETRVVGLDVEWINGNVTVKTGTSEKIRIIETASRELKGDDKLQLSSSGSVLKIKWDGHFLHFGLFQNTYKDLVVELPKDLAADLQEMTCANVAGGIFASGFTAGEMEFSSTSGDMEITDAKGEEGKFSTTSGEVTLKDLEFSQELSANTASGSMEFSNVKAGEVDLNTVSGSVTYSGSADALDADSVSASVRAELSNCPKEADLSSVSGSLTLSIPQNDGFEVEYSGISGEFSSDFPVSGSSGKSGRGLYGTGAAKFSFSTTSGAMRIEERG